MVKLKSNQVKLPKLVIRIPDTCNNPGCSNIGIIKINHMKLCKYHYNEQVKFRKKYNIDGIINNNLSKNGIFKKKKLLKINKEFIITKILSEMKLKN